LLPSSLPGDDDMIDDDIAQVWRRNRRDSMNSIASLNRAYPIRRESIASNADGLDALEAFKQKVNNAEGWGRRDSMNSIASLNLHTAHPISARVHALN